MYAAREASGSGFTLVEVLIVVAILSITGLAVMTLMNSMMSMETRLNVKADIRSLQFDMEGILNSAGCGIRTFPLSMNDPTLNLANQPSTELINGISSGPMTIQKQPPNNIYANRITIQSVGIAPYLNQITGQSSFLAMDKNLSNTAADLTASGLVRADMVLRYTTSPAVISKGIIRVPVKLTKPSGSWSISDCSIDKDQDQNMSEQKVCEIVGGAFDPAKTPMCDTSSQDDAAALDEYCAYQEQCLGLQPQYILAY